MTHLRILLFVLLCLPSFASAAPVEDAETAIAVAKAVCAFEEPKKWSPEKKGDQWIVYVWGTEPVASPSLWIVSIPTSGPTSNTKCIPKQAPVDF
jgi:hypothetical protein